MIRRPARQRDRRQPRLRRRRPELPPRPRQVPRLQFRGQDTNLGEWNGRADARQRGGLARRARRQRHQRAADEVLGRLVGPRQLPERRRRPAGAGRAGQGADRLDPLRPLADGRRAGRREGQYDAIAGAGRRGRPDRQRARPASTTRSAQVVTTATPRTTCWTSATCCSTSSPASARSPSSSSTAARQRLLRRPPRPAPTYPIVTDTTATWAGPPAGDAGRRAAASAACSRSAARAACSTATWRAGLGRHLARRRRQRRVRRHLPRRRRPAPATIASPPRIEAAPGTITAGTGAAGLQRHRAGGLAAARRRDRRRRLQAFVTRVGTDVQEATRHAGPTPRCSPTRSRTAARAWRASRWTRR